MVAKFIEFPEYGAPKIDIENAWKPESIYLKELPDDTVVAFHGIHPVSRYILKLVDGKELPDIANLPESETGRYVKIWLNREANCALGPLNCLAFMPDSDEDSYTMAVGKRYIIPYFDYSRKGDRLELRLNFADTRIEHYRKIFVQRPDGK